ncbi:MAG: hypothetical protein M3P43_05800 [Actinomycetota bacterium]|nr:hypothetical protein [Actinomycetota bacterium]
MVLSFVAVLVASAALIDLGIRSAVLLNLGWDAFMYHIPFAALRGGLHVTYDMNDTVRPLFEGFPPLPEAVQGLLWRLTGSVNATGVVNFLAFAVFLIYCHSVLHAPFWLVALIALTAPMVLIHTTVSYVDLFSNAWLAIGAASCIYLYLFPAGSKRAVLIGAAAGLAAAAWSKYQLVPIAALIFVLLAVVSLRPVIATRFGRRQVVVVLLSFAALASVPYAKNLALYGNPFWPVKVPIVGGLFPYRIDAVTQGAAAERPAGLVGAPQAEVFAYSLFEIDQPTHYPYSDRWIIDQGNAGEGFRMGGFWGTGTVIYLVTMVAMLIFCARGAGIVVSIAAAGVLVFTAFLPQSNELRYFMYLPLTWAATIAMLYPHVRKKAPWVGFGFLLLVLGLFGYMVSQTWTDYQIERVDYQDAADAWGASKWWPLFTPGQTYCVVGMIPIGVLMTGPTMSEYTIVDRSSVSLCPPATILVTNDGIQGPLPA